MGSTLSGIYSEMYLDLCRIKFVTTKVRKKISLHLGINNNIRRNFNQSKDLFGTGTRLKIRNAQNPVRTQNPESPLGYTAANLEGTSNTRSGIIDFMIEAKSRR